MLRKKQEILLVEKLRMLQTFFNIIIASMKVLTGEIRNAEYNRAEMCSILFFCLVILH